MALTEMGDPLADPDILDAELHPEARLRYIQRRMQEEDGVRLTVDNIAFVLRLNRDFDARAGLEAAAVRW